MLDEREERRLGGGADAPRLITELPKFVGKCRKQIRQNMDAAMGGGLLKVDLKRALIADIRRI